MKIFKIILLILTISLSSCYTYIDFKYKGVETIEFVDTMTLSPIHYHYVQDSVNHCVVIEEFKHPVKFIYFVERWETKKRYKIKKSSTSN